jgi:hypothetical protein
MSSKYGMSEAHRIHLRAKKAQAAIKAALEPAAIKMAARLEEVRLARESQQRDEFWAGVASRAATKITQALPVIAAQESIRDRQRRQESLAKMTTQEKLAMGLAESKPARGTVTQSNPAAVEAFKAREARMRIGGGGLDSTSQKIMAGLAESVPARGPTKPAA